MSEPRALVLLVEDDEDDQELTRMAFSRIRANVELEMLDGAEPVLSYLESLTRRWTGQGPASVPRSNGNGSPQKANGEKPSAVNGPAVAERSPCVPILLLVDLKMPGMDGKALLRRLRADPRWKLLPVVILTTSSAPQDVRECYELGCNSYVTKPYRAGELETLFEDLVDYWFQWVQMPGVAD